MVIKISCLVIFNDLKYNHPLSSNARFFFGLAIIVFYIANSVLNVVFIELLSNNFSDSNFEDFETFSHCDYIKGTFEDKYEFIINVKKNCKKIFAVNLISSILEACFLKLNLFLFLQFY